MSSSCVQLILKCLKLDPTKRPTVQEIKNDEWFNGFDWNELEVEAKPKEDE